MSLNWQWSDKMGECTYSNGHKSNLYRGNCFMIAVNEFDNGTYNLAWFAADEQHLKNQLGLTKGYDGCFHDFGIVEMKLDTKYKEVAKFLNLIARAHACVKIELYCGVDGSNG